MLFPDPASPWSQRTRCSGFVYIQLIIDLRRSVRVPSRHCERFEASIRADSSFRKVWSTAAKHQNRDPMRLVEHTQRNRNGVLTVDLCNVLIASDILDGAIVCIDVADILE